MRITINIAATLIIAIAGAILVSYSPFISSPSSAFALGALAVGVTLSILSIQAAASTNATTEDVHANSKTIYVGNLPYRANESDVQTLFAQHGQVFTVRLMKDKRTGKRRGFGFVVMHMNDADSAIAKLNNTIYGDRTLKVREANEPRTEDNE